MSCKRPGLYVHSDFIIGVARSDQRRDSATPLPQRGALRGQGAWSRLSTHDQCVSATGTCAKNKVTKKALTPSY